MKERVAQPGQLADAVRAVSGGGSVIDPKIVESMLAARTRTGGPLRHLTARERDVLAEMATGANNAAIADRLFVTIRAVQRHNNSIFAKLGLTEEGESHRRVRAVLLYLAQRPSTPREDSAGPGPATDAGTANLPGADQAGRRHRRRRATVTAAHHDAPASRLLTCRSRCRSSLRWVR
ncbi:MAG TPA: LuxR C-terminal-related transcriptional regulator [Asanoa sp.]